MKKYIYIALAVLLCGLLSIFALRRESDYMSQYDSIEDVGQYRHPEMSIKPEALVRLYSGHVGAWSNDVGLKDHSTGLQAHLLAQSVCGVLNKRVQSGENKIGAWLEMKADHKAYELSLAELAELGVDVEYAHEDLLTFIDGHVANSNIKGYILTDVERNPESATYAAVAAHVYDAMIVDVRDMAFFSKYEMLCDATAKSTQDAWDEFRDRCNRNGVVIMAVQTAQLREFAIANGLFVININKQFRQPSAGQNIELFEEVLEWLEPNSMIYGWESQLSEDIFVNKVSLYGHTMVPCDWAYNLSLISNSYSERQRNVLCDVLDPTTIDFEQEYKKYVSFYLSDGDNIQWMLNGFEGEHFLTNPYSTQTQTGYGMSVSNLSMICPAQLDYLMALQPDSCSIVETFGGGYYYVDTFAQRANRQESLQRITRNVAAHMRQHRVKVLALMAMDFDSEASIEAYQAYISANDQLEGILAVQYTPYAGGQGEIMWFENSQGVDIPVISVSYSLWNFGENNHELEGAPRYIADKINGEDGADPFSLVCIHAWSRFAQTQTSSLHDQSTSPNQEFVGAGAAKLCMEDLDEDVSVVGIEEMIWRIRMHYRKEQTTKLLYK